MCDTGDCATNHDLSYARSSDLVHWETAAAEPLKLPIRLDEKTIVDPVPAGGGMINSNVRLSFDGQKRPVISYHKFDDKGFTQVYNARLEGSAWRIYQVSDWDWRWEFSGGGAIAFEVRVGPVAVGRDGRLMQSYTHIKYGRGHWVLDEATLKPLETIQDAPPSAKAQKTMEAPDNTMKPQRCGDIGSSGQPGVRYELRWETWGVNRDRKRDGDPPPPSMMKLVRIES